MVSDNPDWPPAPLLYGREINRRSALGGEDVLGERKGRH